MSSESLVYSNRKVCAGWDGQSRRFRCLLLDMYVQKIQE